MATWKLSTEIEANYDGGVMRAKWLIGGVRIVKTKTQRNALPYLYRYFSTEETTLCYVESDNQIYKLINNPINATTTDADWALTNIGGAGSTLTPIGTWAVDNSSPTLSDVGAAGVNGSFYFVTGSPTPQTITIPGLFEGLPVTVVDGNLIVSVGTRWIVVANSTAWNSIDKPQVITDYVNGIVIPHVHTVSDITDLGDYLSTNEYLRRSDIASVEVPFDDVPDSAIISLEFLKEWYYNRVDIDQLISDLQDGGITTFLGLTDTPNSYVGQNANFVRVNATADALEFVGLGTIGDGLYWKLSGTNTLIADVTINGGFKTTFASTSSKISLNVGSIATDPSAITTTVGDFWYNSTVDSYSGRTAIGGNIRFTYISAKVNNAIPFFSTGVTQSPIFEQTNQFTYNNSTSTLSVTNATFRTTSHTGIITDPSGLTAATFGLTFQISSGSNLYRSLSITPIYNFTGTYSGTSVVGIDYNPTITALPGSTSHIAMRTASGRVIFGNNPSSLPLARLHVRGEGTGSAIAFRVEDTGSNTRFTIADNGTIVSAVDSASSTAQFITGGFTVTPVASITSGVFFNMTNTFSYEVNGGSFVRVAPRMTYSGTNGGTGFDVTASTTDALSQLTGTGTVNLARVMLGQSVGVAYNGNFNLLAITSVPASGININTGTSTIKAVSITPSYGYTGTVTGSFVYGIDYSPTFTGATGITHVAARFTTGLVLIGGSSVGYDGSLDVRPVTGRVARMGNLEITTDGIQPTNTGVGIRIDAANRTMTLIGPGTVLNASDTSNFTFGTGNTLRNTQNTNLVQMGATWTPSSGTSIGRLLHINPDLNTTGTYSGTFYGIDYNPTITSTTGLTHIAARFGSGNVQLLSGFLTVASNSASDGLTLTNTSLTGSIKLHISSGNQGTLFFNQSGVINYQQSSSASPNGAIRIQNTSNFVASVTDAAELGIGSTFSPNSGTMNYRTAILNPIYNTTGTYVGTAYGIDYNPTLTSTIGLTNIAWRNTSGQILFGGSSVTINTRLDVRGISGGTVLRVASDSNSLLFSIENTGNIGFFGSAPVSKQISGANLTNSVTTGGTNDEIADITDLTSYGADSATIRNNIYQLARKLKQVNDALRLYGLLT